MSYQLKRIINYSLLIINSAALNAQLKWTNVDSLYQPLPSSVHVFKSTDTIDGKPNIAYYVVADLKDKKLLFDADTTLNRRFTPLQFYQKKFSATCCCKYDILFFSNKSKFERGY
jgi:hypothetical protein